MGCLCNHGFTQNCLLLLCHAIWLRATTASTTSLSSSSSKFCISWIQSTNLLGIAMATGWCSRMRHCEAHNIYKSRSPLQSPTYNVLTTHAFSEYAHSSHTLAALYNVNVQSACSMRTHTALLLHITCDTLKPHITTRSSKKMHCHRMARMLPAPNTCWASTAKEVASHPATFSCKPQKSGKIMQHVHLEKCVPVVREAYKTIITDAKPWT